VDCILLPLTVNLKLKAFTPCVSWQTQRWSMKCLTDLPIRLGSWKTNPTGRHSSVKKSEALCSKGGVHHSDRWPCLIDIVRGDTKHVMTPTIVFTNIVLDDLATSDAHGCSAGSFLLTRTRTRRKPVLRPRMRDTCR
jgi:hypothetical protein